MLGAVRQVLGEARLTAGLDDPEARLLIEWAVEQADLLDRHEMPERLETLLHLVRVARQIVVLWCYHRAYSSASQLAATECLEVCLPSMDESLDPYFVMASILSQIPTH